MSIVPFWSDIARPFTDWRRRSLGRTAVLSLALVLAAHAAAAMQLSEAVLGNSFTEGEPVRVLAQRAGSTINWSVHDFFGAEVATGQTQTTDGVAVLQPHVTGPGYFTLDANSAGERSQTVFAVVPVPNPQVDSRFGVMTHFAKGWDTDVIPLIARLGIGRVRDEQPWSMVERSPGSYEFPPRLTSYMAALAEHHIDPLIILAFGNRFHDDNQAPYTDAGRAAYAAYADAVVRQYAPQLHAVEIWNEYNGDFCQGPCESDRPRYYTAMLDTAYRSLKALDPSLTVAGGAAVPVPLDYLRPIFEKTKLTTMDAVTIHPYRQEPEGVEKQIAGLIDAMKASGAVKPIWATEFGDTADMKSNRDGEARYLTRMSTLLLASGVDRIYWYLLKDYREFTGMGLVRSESDPLGRYAPTPAYVAYAMLVHELGNVRFVRREPTDPSIRAYLFADGTREIRIAWSTMPGATVDLASGGPFDVLSMMGGTIASTDAGGQRSITLTDAPVYLIGNGKALAYRATGRTIANAFDDFSLQQGGKGWTYDAALLAGDTVAVGDRITSTVSALSPDAAHERWISQRNPTVMINNVLLQPGQARDGSLWAVRRWTSPVAGSMHVAGDVRLGNKQASGIVFAIAVDRRVVYRADVGGPAQKLVAFDVPVSVAAGTEIDFMVGPPGSGSVNYDGTRLSATIMAMDER